MGLAILARLFVAEGQFSFWLVCFWLVCRSERKLHRWLLRGRRSAGRSACATCLEDFVLVVLSFAEAG